MSKQVILRLFSEFDSKFKLRMFYSFKHNQEKRLAQISCLTSYKNESRVDVYVFSCGLITEDGSAW